MAGKGETAQVPGGNREEAMRAGKRQFHPYQRA